MGGGSGGLACSKEGESKHLDLSIITCEVIALVCFIYVSFHAAADLGKRVAVLDFVSPSPHGKDGNGLS